MVSPDQVTVNVFNKVTRFTFDGDDKRLRVFAKNYVKKYDSKTAYDLAYLDINKVRASTILQSVKTWELIIKEIKLKPGQNVKEIEILKIYDTITETFQLSPFALFNIFVEKKDNGQSISEVLNICCTQCFSTLLYIHHFFKVLEREYFYKNTLIALMKEIEMINLFKKGDEQKTIMKMAKKDGVDFYEIFE